jgi:hypothetical protein
MQELVLDSKGLSLTNFAFLSRVLEDYLEQLAFLG